MTPPITIPDSAYRPRLTFAHWYETEQPFDLAYDGGTVKISTDGGVGWTDIHPIGGYDGLAYTDNPFIGGDSVFTGSSAGWQIEMFDLAPFAGRSVIALFELGSDPYVNAAGWYLDDVAFVYYVETGIGVDNKLVKLPESIAISTYPNPFNASCRISVNDLPSGFRNNAKLEIYDISGRKVFERNLQKNSLEGKSFVWQPKSESPSGLYFIRLSDGKYIAETKTLLLR
jgi:hypothetical protein